jgi:hypothetical protein
MIVSEKVATVRRVVEKCSLLVGGGAVRRHVHQQRRRAAAIEEVDGYADSSATVARGETSVEVREQVDLGRVVGACGEDTRDSNSNIRLGVYYTVSNVLIYRV